MIERFSDHAANERTYLSWVRTSLAVIAFAVIIEKFSLMIHTTSSTLNANSGLSDTLIDEGVSIVTIVLILTGLFMMIGATYRFMVIRKYIKMAGESKGVSYSINLMLGLLLIFITASGLLYSFHILGKLL